MPDNTHIAFVRFKPMPEHYEVFKRNLKELLLPTLEEPGCLEFKVFEGDPQDQYIYLFERFKDKEALDFHMTQDYTKKILENFSKWFEEPIALYKIKEF